ncbi:hypothetical protein LCGC14_2838470 [marine sediment metagenome]|uniref:Uncharacterized protein n=1 Tax=marine sediment metagenome TaxID=412755 RepID=A0A0F8YC57_9ZZZZ
MVFEQIIKDKKDIEALAEFIKRETGKLDRKNFARIISPEKIEEFAHMSARDKLRWLEEANAFINKAVGLKKRAEWDERFKVFL